MRVITDFSCSHCSVSSACFSLRRDSSESSRLNLSLEALSVSFVRERRSISSFSTERSISSSAVGFDVISIFNFAAASSTKSIAVQKHILRCRAPKREWKKKPDHSKKKSELSKLAGHCNWRGHLGETMLRKGPHLCANWFHYLRISVFKKIRVNLYPCLSKSLQG